MLFDGENNLENVVNSEDEFPSERGHPAEPAGYRTPMIRYSVIDEITECPSRSGAERSGLPGSRGRGGEWRRACRAETVCMTAGGTINCMNNMRLCVIDDGFYE